MPDFQYLRLCKVSKKNENKKYYLYAVFNNYGFFMYYKVNNRHFDFLLDLAYLEYKFFDYNDLPLFLTDISEFNKLY